MNRDINLITILNIYWVFMICHILSALTDTNSFNLYIFYSLSLSVFYLWEKRGKRESLPKATVLVNRSKIRSQEVWLKSALSTKKSQYWKDINSPQIHLYSQCNSNQKPKRLLFELDKLVWNFKWKGNKTEYNHILKNKNKEDLSSQVPKFIKLEQIK